MQHTPVPERYQEFFWIPTLVRRPPEPMPTAIPLSDAVTEAIGSAATFAAPCVVPASDTTDQAVADAGDSATDASALPAGGETSGEWHAPVDGAVAHDARCAAETDHAEEPTEAELPASAAPDREEEPGAQVQPAESGGRERTVSLSQRRGRRAAIVTAFTLAAAAVVIVAMPGLAGRLVRTIGDESVSSARPFAGADDVVSEPPRADALPVIALPVARRTARAVAPAPVVQAPEVAALETSWVAVEASFVEASLAEVVAGVPDAALPAPFVAPVETPLAGEAVPVDMTDETATDLPVGEAVMAAIEPAPTVEAAPGSPTRGQRLRSRSPRPRAQQPARGAAGEAIAAAPIIPISRDLQDVPVEVPGDRPAEVPVGAPEEPPAEQAADEAANGA